jgi:peptidoglycan/xylan/chitin deacetylase (PgdA/CDA1 family)
MSLRWHLKKTARLACARGTAWRLEAPQGVRVLTYHRFAKAYQNPFAVDPTVFEQQMEWLGAQGLSVSLNELVAHQRGERALPPGRVLVTVDDGFASLHTVALPILQRHRIASVAYLPAGLIEQEIASDPERRLSWSQVRELHAAGITIGSHGWSHRSFGAMTLPEMLHEAAESRRCLELKSGASVDSFAYPFGTRLDFSALSQQALRQAGYRSAFTSQHGVVAPCGDALALPRIKIEGGEPLWAFAASCAGGLDAWRFVDRCLWKLQARHGG